MTSEDDQYGSPLNVSSLMALDPVTVRADSKLAQVAERLAEYDLSGMPVVDRDGAVVGVISQTDIVRLRAGPMSSSGWHGLLVRDVMTHPAITVAACASLKVAAGLMTEHHVHRLVVVADHADTPIGVISESDVVREVAALSADD